MPTDYDAVVPVQTAAPDPAQTVHLDTKARRVVGMQLKMTTAVRMEIWGSVDMETKELPDKDYSLVGQFSISDKARANFPAAIIGEIRAKGYRFLRVETIRGKVPQILLQTGF